MEPINRAVLDAALLQRPAYLFVFKGATWDCVLASGVRLNAEGGIGTQPAIGITKRDHHLVGSVVANFGYVYGSEIFAAVVGTKEAKAVYARMMDIEATYRTDASHLLHERNEQMKVVRHG